MNKSLAPVVGTTQTDLKARLRAVFQSAMDMASGFLGGSKFNPVTQKLIVQLSKLAAEKVEHMIEGMTDNEIRNQIYFVRDDLIPFLLGDDDQNPK